MTAKEMCETCNGHGVVSKPPYDDEERCPTCNGTGRQVLGEQP